MNPSLLGFVGCIIRGTNVYCSMTDMLMCIQVDLVAPGVDVLSTAPVGSTRFPAPRSACTLKVGKAAIDCRGMTSFIDSS